jgi:hypothetical protein
VPSVNDVMEQELSSVGRDFYQMVWPRLVASVKLEFDSSSIFFTGLFIDGLESSFRLYFVFTSEMSPSW